jgi:Major Facilitator Superfamily
VSTPIEVSHPTLRRETVSDLPWYRQVTRDQWRAFWAVFLGWVVDSFDFNILAFIIIDIQQSFTVDRALAGLLGTVTLMMRLVGGTIAGTAADRWGRKLPLVLSVLWFSIFAFLSGFSTSYGMLFALRALFGLGMGGEWAAGMPLVFEHWPARFRGLASGLMLGGWYWGYLLAAGPGVASDVLGRDWPGALHTVDPRARSGESDLAGAVEKRGDCDPQDVGRPNLPTRSDWHHHPHDAGDRVVHVHLLLGQLLVSNLPPR